MQVDGYLEGKITSEKTIVISASGRIKGEVTADKLIINGLFDGECYANTVEVLPQGKAHGTIHSDDLSIERGGSFIGKTLPTSSEQIISLPKQEEKTGQLIENKAE